MQKDLHDQVQRAKESTDKSKTELRNFYQNQVEVVVKDKLKEFQEQLENAEKSMHEEIKHREITIARTAAQHIHNLEEKWVRYIKGVDFEYSIIQIIDAQLFVMLCRLIEFWIKYLRLVFN